MPPNEEPGSSARRQTTRKPPTLHDDIPDDLDDPFGLSQPPAGARVRPRPPSTSKMRSSLQSTSSNVAKRNQIPMKLSIARGFSDLLAVARNASAVPLSTPPMTECTDEEHRLIRDKILAGHKQVAERKALDELRTKDDKRAAAWTQHNFELRASQGRVAKQDAEISRYKAELQAVKSQLIEAQKQRDEATAETAMLRSTGTETMAQMERMVQLWREAEKDGAAPGTGAAPRNDVVKEEEDFTTLEVRLAGRAKGHNQTTGAASCSA